jgi:hypothetical protein
MGIYRQDRGGGYADEHGARFIFPIGWNDTMRTFTIGARPGSYPDMKPGHVFHVVIVRSSHGGGVTAHPGKLIHYTGATVVGRF